MKNFIKIMCIIVLITVCSCSGVSGVGTGSDSGAVFGIGKMLKF